MKISVKLEQKSLDQAIQKLEKYQRDLEKKAKLLCERLATIGATGATLGFARSVYTGNVDYRVSVEETDGGYRILADGETVLILEFGAGVRYGRGHPQETEFGMGAGTYPGQTHAMDREGWYIPKAHGGGHTYGNPPNMPMYNAAQEIRKEIQRVAEEVFRS